MTVLALGALVSGAVTAVVGFFMFVVGFAMTAADQYEWTTRFLTWWMAWAGAALFVLGVQTVLEHRVMLP